MTPQELKNSILQLAIQGKLVEYWGGTLWEVAVLAGIGVDLCLKSRMAGILVETNQKKVNSSWPGVR